LEQLHKQLGAAQLHEQLRAATLRVALSLALSSEPHCSAAPRITRSPAATQLHEQLGSRCSATPRTAQSCAPAQLHEEGDGSCPSPSSSWGCAAAPCFFFLATLCCSIAAFFFLFSCCYATELPSPSYMVGIYFFCFVVAYVLVQYN
jgi:hypothetical protein